MVLVHLWLLSFVFVVFPLLLFFFRRPPNLPEKPLTEVHTEKLEADYTAR
jgi:hypothetical protein